MSEKDKTQDTLTKKEVIDVLKFATHIYTKGICTPSLLNTNLNELNNNPTIPTANQLDKALKTYTESASELQAFNESAEIYDMLFKKTIDYYTGLLAFDCAISPSIDTKAEDMSTEEYKEDRKRFETFLERFNYRDEFRKVVKNLLRRETFFVWLRDSKGTISKTGEIDLNIPYNNKSTYTLQIMPQSYCKVTGYWEKGLLYDFDMNYFLKAGVDINQYDPEFKKYYKDTFESSDLKYNPTSGFNKRTGTFSTWTQTSPKEGAFCFKFDNSNFNDTPFLSAMIGQVISNKDMKKLQADKYMLEAKGILAGEIGMLEKQQSGQVQDAMKFNPDTLMHLLKLVKMGLEDNINAVALPLEEIDFYQYVNKSPNMYKDQLQITGNNGVSAGSLIYSSDKPSEFELQAQITSDFNTISKVYRQFENFINYYANMKTKKYKFLVKFSGCTQPFMRKLEKENLISLMNVGIVLNPSVYSKLVDMSPMEFESCLIESKASGWTEKLTSGLQSIHTQNANGRPQVSSVDRVTEEPKEE